MASSGLYTFNPSLSDVVLAAYARCQIRRTAITTEHLMDAYNESNYLLSAEGPPRRKVGRIPRPGVQGVYTAVAEVRQTSSPLGMPLQAALAVRASSFSPIRRWLPQRRLNRSLMLRGVGP